jgi:LmbE family N-acetylglucosaminyl deacetylase
VAAQKVLVIGPHGLDEVLGCGGTIARHVDDGDKVDIFLLFGDGTRRDAARRVAAAEAASILGAAPPTFGGLAEGRGDTLPLIDVVSKVEAAVTAAKPSVVYVGFGGSLHVDHQVTFRAAVTAIRPLPGATVRAIYAYEILSSTEWAPGPMGFRPNRFVEISRQLDRKMAALAKYGAEMRPAPHARSPEAVRALAVSRGASVGLAAAEGFEVVREIR